MSDLSSAEKRQKFLWELKDLLVGAAFPFIIMCIFSSTIIMFASSEDLAIELLAVIGGNVLLLAAYVIFGRQNGATAFHKFVLNETKRSLNSSDKRSIYATGEYAVWKGVVIPLITCIPFIIFQIVDLIYPNAFTSFMLQYACGWAYFPISLTGAPQALDFLFIILPVGAHLAGYILGKKKEEKLQEEIQEESQKIKSKKRKK
ncbi:MAG: hypothetical protein ACI4MH_04110 [Candidatus Coproplasma sp.]